MEYPAGRTQVLRGRFEDGRYEMALRGPAAPLRGLVGGYCLYEEERGRHATHQHLPHPGVTLILSLGGAIEGCDPAGAWRRFGEGEGFVAGLHTAPARTASGPHQRGMEVRLTPLGAHRLLGLPMHELVNRSLSLEDLLGRAGFELAGRLLETRGLEEPFAAIDAFFAARACRVPRDSAPLAEAWRLLEQSHGRVPIGRIAARLGWSRKRLVAAFREQVGLPPKQMARVLRFDRAMETLRSRPDVRWSEVALACGYHDQAHLAREVRALSGQTPRELAARLLDESGAMAAG